ncbi:MAG: WD40 repeat domain-containing protein [Polyangia bacterium]
MQAEQSLRAAALSRQPEKILQALVEGMLAAQPDRARGQYNARHWEGLLAAAAQLTIPRTVAQGPRGGSWAAASADGGLIAIAAANQGAAVIDARSGARRAVLAGGGRPIGFSSDDSVVWGFDEGSLRSWESRTGKPLRTLPHPTPPIHAAALTADGRRIAVAAAGPNIELWDTASGRRIGELAAREQGRLVALSLAADGKELAAVGADGRVVVLALPSGRVVQRVAAGAAVRTVALSHDGTKLCTGGDDGIVRVFARSTGSLLSALAGYKAPLLSAQFTPQDHEILTASEDGTVRLWELDAGRSLPAPEGQTDDIRSALFFDQGRKILTSGSEQPSQQWGPDQTLRAWDADTGRSLARQTLVPLAQGDKGDAGSILALDPSGARLLTRRAFGPLGIWDASTLRLRQAIPPGGNDHTEQLVTPDASALLLISDEPRKAQLYDVRSGRRLSGWSVPDSMVVHALSPDRKRVLVSRPPGPSFTDAAAGLCDSASGRPVLALTQADQLLTLAAFSADGKRIVGIEEDGSTGGVWDAQSGARLQSFTRARGAVEDLRISPSGQRFLLRQEYGQLQVYDARTGQAVFAEPLTAIVLAEFSPDGQRLITAKDRDDDVSVWDLDTGKRVQTLRGHKRPVTALAYSPDGQRILTASADRSLIVWRTSDGKQLLRFGRGVRPDEPGPRPGAAPAHLELARLAAPDPVQYAAFSADGSHILTATDNEIIVWSAATYRWQDRHDNSGTSPILSACFSPDGAQLLMATSNAGPHGHSTYVERWDASSGQPLDTVHATEASMEHTSIASGGGLLAVLIQPLIGSDATVQLRDAKDGKPLRAIEIPSEHGQIAQLVLSPDGSRLLTVSPTRTELWDTPRGTQLLTLPEEQTSYVHAAFSPDGRRVATAGEDGVARIHDAATGAVQRRFTGHTEPLTHLALSPDGRQLATAGKDATVRIWDTGTGRPLLVHKLPHDPTAVGFSPDGARLVVAAQAAYVYSTRHADYHAFGCRVLRALQAAPAVDEARLRQALSACP